VQERTEHERALVDQNAAYQELVEKYERLRLMIFGRSSEKLSEQDIKQLRLFNEAENGASEQEAESAATVEVSAHRRVKRGRKPIDENLPREIVVHDVSDADKTCPCCGAERPLIDEETTEEVDIIPAKLKVTRHVRRVYGACRCEGFSASGVPAVLRSPMPPRLIPGSIATAGLVAYALTGKFVDSLPFYRQEKIFARLGIHISRATLCRWAISVGTRCGSLIDLMWELSLSGPFMQMDETRLQVLHEPGREATTQSFMWVNVGYLDTGQSMKPLILFHYHPNRTKDIPLSVLRGFSGHLQTDGYEGYTDAGSQPGVIHTGCWAHARRGFHKASQITKKPGSAEEALSRIAKLYRIDGSLRAEMEAGHITREQFVQRRCEQTTPVLEKFAAWIDERIAQVPPKTTLGEALQYTKNQWSKLIRYLDAWYLTPDNNAAENCIRPFVVGRRNWLFNDQPLGAHASAALYSLVTTAKANNLEPYHYLRYLFTRLPEASTREDYLKLLPTSLTPANLAIS